MKLSKPTSSKIDLSSWRSEGLDDAVQELADQIKQMVIDTTRDVVSYLLTEDSTCYFIIPESGEPRLQVCVGTEPKDPEWPIDLKEVLELSDIEGEDASRLANYFNDIAQFLRERAG